MNVTHITLPEGFIETVGDKLEFLMNTQAQHAAEYLEIEKKNGYIRPESLPVNINHRHDQQYVKDLVFRCIEELTEATNCLKIRPHSQTDYVTDEVHFIEEMSDALHYFLEALVVLGLSPEDVVRVYYAKSEVNKFRRASNY